MSEGLLMIRSSDVVCWSLVLIMIPLVIVMEGVNLNEIFLVLDSIGASRHAYAMTEVFTQAGSIVGAMIAGRILSDRLRAGGNLLAAGASGAIIVAMGFSTQYWVYAMLSVLIGATGAGGASLLFTLLSTRTPEEHRGKIMAGVNGVMRGVALLAMGLGAVVGRAVGPREVFWMAGTLGMLVVAVGGSWYLYRTRRDAVWRHTAAEAEELAAA